jgi:hypothetical protein
MSKETISALIGWLPMFLMIGAFFYFSKRAGMQARSPSGTSLIELYEQQVKETRRMNDKLERIAAALEQRSA